MRRAAALGPWRRIPCGSVPWQVTGSSFCGQARRVIVVSILATDMTCHFGLTDELKNVAIRSGDSITALLSATKCPLRDDEDVLVELPKPDRDVLLKTLLHAADISNPCKPFAISKEWSDRVLQVRASMAGGRLVALFVAFIALIHWCGLFPLSRRSSLHRATWRRQRACRYRPTWTA